MATVVRNNANILIRLREKMKWQPFFPDPTLLEGAAGGSHRGAPIASHLGGVRIFQKKKEKNGNSFPRSLQSERAGGR